MTKLKCNLIILGEDHSKPQAKQLTLALLQAAQDRGYKKVVFAFETFLNRDSLKERVEEYENYGSYYEEKVVVDAKISLFNYVLDDKTHTEYLELEDKQLVMECDEYIAKSELNRVKFCSTVSTYHSGLVELYEKREEVMANRLFDYVDCNSVNSFDKDTSESNEIFIVLLAGNAHIKSLENLLKTKTDQREINFDLDIVNIPVVKDSPQSNSSSYREENSNHSVKGCLDVKKVKYERSEDGVKRIKIFHRERGIALSEEEGEYLSKLDLMLGGNCLRSLKKPPLRTCGSDYVQLNIPVKTALEEQKPSSEACETSATQIIEVPSKENAL